MPSEPEPHSRRRERHRQQTRRALVTAALELFAARGYAGTTVAAIAAGADVSTRTFFGYFPSKEEVVFAGAEERLARAVAAVGAPQPGERPAEVLLRVLMEIVDDVCVGGRLLDRTAPLRLRLILTVPALQGVALRRVFLAEQRLARQLHRAFPDELDASTAAALVGAVVGALLHALVATGGDGERVAELLAGDPAGVAAGLRRAAGTVLAGLRIPDPPAAGQVGAAAARSADPAALPHQTPLAPVVIVEEILAGQ